MTKKLRRVSDTRQWIGLCIVVLLGILIRLSAISLFAHTKYLPVDVYFVDTQSAQAVAGLQNPYSQVFSVHGYSTQLLAYLPFMPVYYSPFFILGDIRYGNIFADVLIMISLYYISSANKMRFPLYTSIFYAIFPLSIWLTSIASTNMMVGTAFLLLTVAAALGQRYFWSSVFLGIAIATNQLVFLAVPILLWYFLERQKITFFFVSLFVSFLIIFPFFFSGPSVFYGDVVGYQLARPLQSDGLYDLNGLVNLVFGSQLSTIDRFFVFLGASVVLLHLIRKKSERLIASIAVVLSVGAFVLPVDGFLNYYLIPATVWICLVPQALDRLGLRNRTPLSQFEVLSAGNA
jgi:hypothetical protein